VFFISLAAKDSTSHTSQPKSRKPNPHCKKAQEFPAAFSGNPATPTPTTARFFTAVGISPAPA
jgi:hypothetical protein